MLYFMKFRLHENFMEIFTETFIENFMESPQNITDSTTTLTW